MPSVSPRLELLGSGEGTAAGSRPLCPFDLRVTAIARFLNCELVDDPVYDGVELQYFDDAVHGTGMLAFLSRRTVRRVDYYYEPGLVLDRASFSLGGGTGAWTETTFDAARLEVADDGVHAEVRFSDIDGRQIEVIVDDRDGRRRRRGALLAPVGSGIERPNALLLVLLRGFDLVRSGGTRPLIRIDGRSAATGRLPGARLHRHLLIKYAAPLCATELNRNHNGPVAPVDPGGSDMVELTADGHGIAALGAGEGAHHARFVLEPPLPSLAGLPDRAARAGVWTVEADGLHITAGTWSARRRADDVELTLDVRGRWKPGPLPLLMRLVTRIVPVFREWPTTYRWTATVALGPAPTMVSRWVRTTADRGDAYRRATQ